MTVRLEMACRTNREFLFTDWPVRLLRHMLALCPEVEASENICSASETKCFPTVCANNDLSVDCV